MHSTIPICTKGMKLAQSYLHQFQIKLVTESPGLWPVIDFLAKSLCESLHTCRTHFWQQEVVWGNPGTECGDGEFQTPATYRFWMILTQLDHFCLSELIRKTQGFQGFWESIGPIFGLGRRTWQFRGHFPSTSWPCGFFTPSGRLWPAKTTEKTWKDHVTSKLRVRKTRKHQWNMKWRLSNLWLSYRYEYNSKRLET